MPTNSELLSEVPLFARLDASERELLAQRLDGAQFAAGATIYQAGDPGDALYIVTAGAVEISFKNDTGDRILLERCGPGQFFGETSLIDGGPRTATATCVEAVHALVVDRGDLDAFLRLHPDAAMDLLSAAGKRLRDVTTLLRHSASRNVNEEVADNRTAVMRIADWISAFSGSIPFLLIHLVIFAIWIGLNISPLKNTALGNWDPFPFGLLTMVVSLEAILLSVFVLLSQNRQVARDSVRNQIEYDVNLKAELEVAHLHEKVDRIHSEILGRLDQLKR